MTLRALTLGACMWLAAANATAQTCLGLPSFESGPFQATVGGAFTEGARSFQIGFAGGSDELFGGAILGFTNPSNLDSTATTFGVHAGASFVVNDRERVEVCPVAAFNATNGPDVGPVDITGLGVRVGGRVGIVALETGSVEVVPTFGVDIAYDRVTAEFGDVDSSTSETYAIGRVGVGFILNKNVGLLSELGIPLGLEGSDPVFSFVVAFHFGGR